MLCTLHNHPLLTLELYLSSLSLFLSLTLIPLFLTPPLSSISLFLLWQQSRSSLLHPSLLSLQSQTSKVGAHCFSNSVSVFVFSSLPLLLPCYSLYFPSSLSSFSAHLLCLPPALLSPSGLIRHEGGCLVCV